MQPLPLHPMIVHVPLVLALVAPLVLGGLTWAAWRDRLRRRTLIAAVVLQAVVFGGGLLALRTGEADEEKVESVVAEAPIEAHEERAETFVVAAGVVLALALGAAVIRVGAVARVLTPAALAASLVAAGLGVATGHAGGELVYRHGAGAAHAGAPGAGLGEARNTPTPTTARGERDDD